MKYLRQIISIVLAAVLLFSGVTVSVQAEDISSDVGAEQEAAELLDQEEVEKEEIETEQEAPDINSGEEPPDTASRITEDAIQTEEAFVENVVNTVGESCLAVCTTDFDKALWLHDWILEHAECDDLAGGVRRQTFL